MKLAELFNYYSTDKDKNGYSQVYFMLFENRRESVTSLLEIGIGTMMKGVHSSMVGFALNEDYTPGGSLRAWRDYFMNAQIYGMDIQPDTQFIEERITTFLCNSTDNSEVKDIVSKIPGDKKKFDIIIDDGSHVHTDQLQTLRNLFRYVNKNGIYVIEDLGNGLALYPEAIAAAIGKDYPYIFCGIKNNICVIYKNKLPSKRENY